MSENAPVENDIAAPRSANAPLIASPGNAAWQEIGIEQYWQRPPNDVTVPPLAMHFLSVFTGEPVCVVQARDGGNHCSRMTLGDITLMPAGMSSRWGWDGNADLLHLYLAPERVARVAEQADIGGSLELRNRFTTRHAPIAQIAHLLLAEARNQNAFQRLAVDCLADALIVQLLRDHAAVRQHPLPERGRLPNATFAKITDYIQAHLDDDLSLDELAGVAGIGTAHFRWQFKQTTGMAPHQYVIRCRVEQARVLLRRGRLSVAEVAAAVGFFDQSHLSRHMRRLLGVTPKSLYNVSPPAKRPD